ncbi:MAG: Rrf2 family transcriptional regulator [candidate division Zixibacteria bacterium]|jgi:Rrf2 family protein|nr:Rrf2 family transcriptional regulator [candidate division Zixibacteria bacterium]
MITKKTEYAIRAVWELGQSSEGLRTAAQVAEAQGIPPKYLPQIVAELVQAGLLVSARGYRGGLRLSRPPQAVTLLDIVEAIQGRLDLFECQRGAMECMHLPGCELKAVYHRAQDAMEAVFRQTRLTDIHFHARERGINVR